MFKLCSKNNFEKRTLPEEKTFFFGGVQKVNKGEILFNFYFTSFFIARVHEMAFGSFHTCLHLLPCVCLIVLEAAQHFP